MVLDKLLGNSVFLSVAAAMIVVQVLKGVLRTFKEKKLDFSFFLISGGMPSGHSALVCSITAAIYLSEGLSSVFMISVVLALVIMYDAMILRMTVGRNSEMIRKMAAKLKINNKDHKLTQSHGHTPLQVVAGGIIGIIIAILMNSL